MIDNDIDRYIVRNLPVHPRDIVRVTAERFGFSRQGIHKHLQKLIDADLISAEGQTRSRRYSLRKLVEKKLEVDLEGLEEHVVWRQAIAPPFEGYPDTILRIAQYGFTEILNNAIVHSHGKKVRVGMDMTAANADFVIWDDGVGIFRKIREELSLEDERHAILELSKGKLTTNPARHSGEGIFFTTRSFDEFAILSGELSFVHVLSGDWLVDEQPFRKGTAVVMSLDLFTGRTLRGVFDSFTSKDGEFGFTKTQIPIFLAKYGDESLVSRSQAKRVVARLDRFKEAILDFEGVTSIGQAFADEIFRVFQSEHPDVNITWVNANEEVSSMIGRVRSDSGRS
jgi:anti-sigma regulatory factor (Ser/Thr protein kinase)